MHSVKPKLNAPGLKYRRYKNGTTRLYWVAKDKFVKRGYKPKTAHVPYSLDNPDDHPLIERMCQKLQAEMLQWGAGRVRGPNSFNGTVKDLVRRYQVDKASPYHDVKHNTKRTYDERMDKIERAFGARLLRNIKVEDFRRWYNAAKEPREPGGPERFTKAQNLMRMIRQLLSYGVMAEIPECKRLHEIISQMRFKGGSRNRNHLTYDMVEAFIGKALEKGRPSLALATAIQFETGMRQRDVIGEWLPIRKGEPEHGIVLNGKRWANGLTWNDLANDLTVVKQTTKTGQMVAHDLKLCPLVMHVLEQMNGDRIGPVITDEKARRPYADHAFALAWRGIATEAGIPKHIKNMQARAGAITEAEDAGADLDTIRASVGHSTAAMTARYSRGPLGKSREVQRLRLAHRNQKMEK